MTDIGKNKREKHPPAPSAVRPSIRPSGDRPDDRPDDRPAHRPSVHPGDRPGDRLGDRPGDRPSGSSWAPLRKLGATARGVFPLHTTHWTYLTSHPLYSSHGGGFKTCAASRRRTRTKSFLWTQKSRSFQESSPIPPDPTRFWAPQAFPGYFEALKKRPCLK